MTLRASWPIFQRSIDFGIWAGSYVAATVLRVDFHFEQGEPRKALLFAVIAGLVGVAISEVGGAYRRRWRYASPDEIVRLAEIAVLVGALLAVFNRLDLPTRWIPTGASAMAPLIALTGLFGTRFAGRQLVALSARPSRRAAQPVLIFGAGAAGTRLVRNLLDSGQGTYVPVGLLDDAPQRQQLRVGGVRVLGGRHEMADAARRLGVDLVIFAMPSADGATLRELVDLARAAGLQACTLPALSELVSSQVGVADVRPVSEADLLGRRAIQTDVEAIAGYVTGARVLVTGAGGSIGSELCRQLHGFGPKALIMLDRDESGLHAVQLSIEGRGLLDNDNLVVADIRDPERLDAVFARHRPDVVFHAAALKHLPLLESHPLEAVKTNVLGTLNVLQAAKDHGVARFVNISTDKAANPTSVLGLSKRVAERLTAHFADELHLPYVSVRFGNVLGSRGSVLPAFERQIALDRPITVTHPEVTRYFMTIPEAVQLVIQAGALGRPGEVLVLDMGEPVKIVDVARRLIEASGKKLDIIFTGLRPGEKLHEELHGLDEVSVNRDHPLIMHAAVPALVPDRVLLTPRDDDDAVGWLTSRVAQDPLIAEMRRIIEMT